MHVAASSGRTSLMTTGPATKRNCTGSSNTLKTTPSPLDFAKDRKIGLGRQRGSAPTGRAASHSVGQAFQPDSAGRGAGMVSGMPRDYGVMYFPPEIGVQRSRG